MLDRGQVCRTSDERNGNEYDKLADWIRWKRWSKNEIVGDNKRKGYVVRKGDGENDKWNGRDGVMWYVGYTGEEIQRVRAKAREQRDVE